MSRIRGNVPQVETKTVSGEDVYNPVVAEGGRVVDINNISGRVKAEMIMNGELDVDRFIAPPNMPGQRLKELRNKHRDNVLKDVNKIVKQAKVSHEFSVGETVLYKGYQTEITTVSKSGEKVKVRKKNGNESNWVYINKIKLPKE